MFLYWIHKIRKWLDKKNYQLHYFEEQQWTFMVYFNKNIAPQVKVIMSLKV